MEEICKRIYFLLESKFLNHLTDGFRIMIQKSIGSAGYEYGYLDIKDKDIEISLFSFSPLNECFEHFYKKKGENTDWNRVIFKVNIENRTCDIVYQFDKDLQNIIDGELKNLESIMWRSKFFHGTFFDTIYDKLVNDRGIQKEVAGSLNHVLSVIITDIDEEWKETYIEISISPLFIDIFYLNLNNQRKEIIWGNTSQLCLENRNECIENIKKITHKHGFIWNHATFFVTSEGDFSISLNYRI